MNQAGRHIETTKKQIFGGSCRKGLASGPAQLTVFTPNMLILWAWMATLWHSSSCAPVRLAVPTVRMSSGQISQPEAAQRWLAGYLHALSRAPRSFVLT